jgi:predicted PurR-regulated permease PerM
MPFLLILFGVLGGAIAFGFIGVFLGPTLLAVGYRVVQEWFSRESADAAQTTIKSAAGIAATQTGVAIGQEVSGG